ncbi:hypothetical protein BCBMB205_30270 [Bacillus sp. CN2]|nr:hypothetical protein BCBMB205_30270 [Bacillus velezensis]ARZ59373.1 hypothetical protein BAGQ_3168 [Bacillus velezensis]GFR54447.1 hypothetical protein BCBMB205_30270 [Bacillus sp. CN2]
MFIPFAAIALSILIDNDFQYQKTPQIIGFLPNKVNGFLI